MCLDLTLSPSFNIKRGWPKPKNAYNSLIIDPRGLQCKINLQVIMGWEYSDVVRFDLWPLRQGQMMVHWLC